MPNESFLMTFSSLGLTLAGFVGLIAALRSDEARSAITAYRIRTIVVLGILLTVTGLGTVVTHTILADVSAAVRVGTLLVILGFVRGLVIDTRPGPAWPAGTEVQRKITIAILLVMLALGIGNLWFAGVGYLEALMLLGLIGPLSIFYNTIKDSTSQRPDEER